MTDQPFTHSTSLVVGGTGKTGRRVVQRLRSRGVPTRIGSRAAVIPFEWTDEATWLPVLRDVQSVYVTFAPDLAVPGAASKVGALARLAHRTGVRRLVLLSGRGEPEAQRAEQAVQESFDRPTIIRSSWFSQNFSENFLLDSVLRGEIALPAGMVAEPFVDADDIADVAVAALTDDGLRGRVYEVTGPRLLTFADAAEEIAAATGRGVRYRPITVEDFSATLAGQQVPPGVIDLLVGLFTVTLDGRNARVTDGVRQALGREPRDFGDYARSTAATGVWRPIGAPELAS